ncbi:esterase [Gordonia phage Jalebi]|uniref:Esterase n=2 Tax=Lambovirus TaxID=2843412 RepID=A0AA49GZ68_9CAUD|nr:esterase [Gordonia phage Jalebi]WNM69353.1 hydrolase [Gordonia phage Sampudon]WNO26227.1 esterase [Gordonia phage GOATification]WNO27121.1 esterase [Gordonia phage Fulcrum]
MANVWYIGDAQERTLTFGGSTFFWNKWNGWSINESAFTSQQLQELDADPGFLLGQTGPRTLPPWTADPVTGRESVYLAEIKKILDGAQVSRALAGDADIKKMALSPTYNADLLSPAPTITQGTAATSGLTKAISSSSPLLFWPGTITETSGSAVIPRGKSYDDGTRSASVESCQVVFETDAAQFDFRVVAATGLKWRLWADGKANSASLANLSNYTGAGAYINVNLGSASVGKSRKITIEFENLSAPIQFQGLQIPPTASLTVPRFIGPRVMIVGDSIGHGMGSGTLAEGYARGLGRIMGWLDVWHSFSSCSSSGLVKAASANNGPYVKRLYHDILPNSPDLVIIQGSLNDTSYVDQNLIGPALVEYVTKLRSQLPNVVIIVTSPLYFANPSVAINKVRDELKIAAAALNVPFIDLQSAGTFTGTGKVGATVGDGNADFYRGTDGTHPSKEGSWYIANRIAGAIANVLKIPL